MALVLFSNLFIFAVNLVSGPVLELALLATVPRSRAAGAPVAGRAAAHAAHALRAVFREFTVFTMFSVVSTITTITLFNMYTLSIVVNAFTGLTVLTKLKKLAVVPSLDHHENLKSLINKSLERLRVE